MLRIHGGTAARPLEVFNELERAVLHPVPPRYPALRGADLPVGEGATAQAHISFAERRAEGDQVQY